jgi:hypothetical protein
MCNSSHFVSYSGSLICTFIPRQQYDMPCLSRFSGEEAAAYLHVCAVQAYCRVVDAITCTTGLYDDILDLRGNHDALANVEFKLFQTRLLCT